MKKGILFALAMATTSFTAYAEGVYSVSEIFADSEIYATSTLANLSVGPAMRRYSVRVRNCGSNISHVMLRVANAGVRVNGAGVVYADGSSESYGVSTSFEAGYNSGWVNVESFKNPNRCASSVYVNAQSTDGSRNARVTVFGSTGG